MNEPSPFDPVEFVHRWIKAYEGHRDAEMLEMAHPDIILHPRRGQGRPDYHGIDGMLEWQADLSVRPTYEFIREEVVEGGLVVAEMGVEGFTIVAVFEIRDEKMFEVWVYISDRGMMDFLGAIDRRSEERRASG